MYLDASMWILRYGFRYGSGFPRAIRVKSGRDKGDLFGVLGVDATVGAPE